MPIVNKPMQGTAAEKICELVLAGKSKAEILTLANTNDANYSQVVRKWRAKGFLPPIDGSPARTATPAPAASGKTSDRMAKAVELYNAGDDEAGVGSKMGITESAAKFMLAGARNAGMAVRAAGGKATAKAATQVEAKKPRKKWTRKAKAEEPAPEQPAANPGSVFEPAELGVLRKLIEREAVAAVSECVDRDVPDTMARLRPLARLLKKLQLIGAQA